MTIAKIYTHSLEHENFSKQKMFVRSGRLLVRSGAAPSGRLESACLLSADALLWASASAAAVLSKVTAAAALAAVFEAASSRGSSWGSGDGRYGNDMGDLGGSRGSRRTDARCTCTKCKR